MVEKYNILDKVVFRSHLLKFDPFLEKESIEELLRNPMFLEAIYISSPSLYERIEILLTSPDKISEKDKEDLNFSIRKYAKRASFRSTPFGLMAGIGTVQFGEQTKLILNEPKYFWTKMQIDYSLSTAMVAKILEREKELPYKIRWKVNDTFTDFMDEYRYIKPQEYNTAKNFSTFSVKKNEYLIQIIKLCQYKLVYYDEIQKQFLDKYPDFKSDEFREFFNELVESGILFSELQSSVTGTDPLIKLSSILSNNHDFQDEYNSLNKIISSVKKINAKGVGNTKRYRQLIADIKNKYDISITENKSFNVILSKTTNHGSLSNNIRKEIRQVSEILSLINNFSTTAPRLTTFFQAFVERYGDKEIPLMEALDHDSGIKYGTSGKLHPLVQGNIRKKRTRASVQLTENESYLQNKLIESLMSGHQCFELQKEDIEYLSSNKAVNTNLPPSFSILVQDIGNFEGCQFAIKMAGSASAINFLGRFGEFNPEINELCMDINNAELESINDNEIYAEIVHIAQDRAANVIKHPAFRKYEIPCLTLPGESASPIWLDDLYLRSTDMRTVQLYSKTQKKLVRPVKSNMHNSENFGLPVYQFLCDYQNFGYTPNISMYWGNNWGNMVFTPRITYKNFILIPKTWHLKSEFIEPFIKFQNQQAINEIRFKYKIPEKVLLTEGDNIIPINFCEEKDCVFFFKTIKKSKVVRLTEYYYGHEFIAENKQGDFYANEYLFSFVKQADKTIKSKQLNTYPVIKREFFPFDEWLYFKLYCGKKTIDKILKTTLPLFISKHKSKIDTWFFIRYADNADHLRVRFKMKQKINDKFIATFYKVFQPYILKNELWKITIDTYERELLRYGYNSIEVSERLFSYDSEMIILFLSQEKLYKDNGIDRFLFSINFIYKMLLAFQFEHQNMISFILQLRSDFYREIEITSTSRLKRIREKERKNIIDLLELRNESASLQEFYDNSHLSDFYDTFKNNAVNISLSKEMYLSSIFHMHINRLFDKDQRLCEALIYDFLYVALVSLKQKMKNGNK